MTHTTQHYEGQVYKLDEEAKAFYADVTVRDESGATTSKYSGSWFYDERKCLNFALLEEADIPMIEQMERNYRFAQENGVSMQGFLGETISWKV